LIAESGNIIVNIKYSREGAYVIKDIIGKKIPQNQWDDSIKGAFPISGRECGESTYDGT